MLNWDTIWDMAAVVFIVVNLGLGFYLEVEGECERAILRLLWAIALLLVLGLRPPP